jgi:hypothetical protein
MSEATPSGRTPSSRTVLTWVVVAGGVVVGLSILVGFVGPKPGFQWELASLFGTALGTTLLAASTGALAYSTWSDVRATWRLAAISQATLDAEVQPVLVDVVPGSAAAGDQELIAYEPAYADGTKNVALDAVDVRHLENGNFACSVPLRNAGAGLAFITDDPRLTHPARADDFIGKLTKQAVPRGEQTRAYFGPGLPLETYGELTLVVKVPYTAASGSGDASAPRVFWTEATVKKRGDAWRVVQVAIRREGEEEPFVRSGAAV